MKYVHCFVLGWRRGRLTQDRHGSKLYKRAGLVAAAAGGWRQAAAEIGLQLAALADPKVLAKCRRWSSPPPEAGAPARRPQLEGFFGCSPGPTIMPPVTQADGPIAVTGASGYIGAYVPNRPLLRDFFRAPRRTRCSGPPTAAPCAESSSIAYSECS